MVEICEREGVRLMEAFMYRLHPSWVAVRDLVASGRIGRLIAVDSWFSYFNDDPTNIRNIAAFGGGALFDIGCYNVNLSRMLFDAEPVRVDARLVRDPKTGVDVLTSAILAFDAGFATFTCSTRAEPDQRVDIYGTDGRLRVHIPFNVPPDRPTEVTLTAGGDPPVAPDFGGPAVRRRRSLHGRGRTLRGGDPRRPRDPDPTRGCDREPPGHRAHLRGRRRWRRHLTTFAIVRCVE